MPRVSQAHRVARRAEIIDAALRCFARSGYQRTTMADIIAESGLSAGAIYGYFGGKQELLVAVADHVLGDRGSALTDDSGFAVEGPGDIIAALLHKLDEGGLGSAVLQLWAEGTIDPEIGELVRTVFGRLRAFVTDLLAAWAEENPSAIGTAPRTWAAERAPIVLGLAQGFIVQKSLIEDFDADAYIAGARAAL
ncbi:TetR/AcrR family transcriptional regulator [Rhodococcus sp. CX]|uniref:TetR/AcrR family transcriptional regulator n=1 Tax=Rhodococcus sp. CX TaxID=2789880 RepID=UPI0018CDA411|nr:TetR/AcrR family transcriptional regulator [Rhodococcus sp. CX]MBH0119582.1 TetR/AcrR family transcriptional regulator [Rhodococcus sp. CX]